MLCGGLRKAMPSPDYVLLFIPGEPEKLRPSLLQRLTALSGNPGLVDFYFQFLSALHEKHNTSSLAILAHGFLDHFPGIENGPGCYLPEDSLVVQVEAALEIVDALVLCYSGFTKLLAAGHSAGSWITVQVKNLIEDGSPPFFILHR
jgi:hypothetical protein